MASNTVTVRPATTISLSAARLSFAAAALSLLSLAVLHALSPEFDPSWRMVSEYALGNYGWVLALMFLSMAVSCIALFFAVKSQVQTIGGKIGLGFLLAAAVGLTMASIFDVTHGLHGLAALIGNPGLIIAALLISVSLGRNEAWSSARRLLWTANPPWMSFALMLAVLFIGLSRSGGQFGPDVPIGWPNRLLMLAYGVWLMVVAWRAARLSRESR